MSYAKPSDAEVAPALAHLDEAVLITRLSQARASGEDDEAAAEELLRRAAAHNKAALDRLGR